MRYSRTIRRTAQTVLYGSANSYSSIFVLSQVRGTFSPRLVEREKKFQGVYGMKMQVDVCRGREFFSTVPQHLLLCQTSHLPHKVVSGVCFKPSVQVCSLSAGLMSPPPSVISHLSSQTGCVHCINIVFIHC